MSLSLLKRSSELLETYGACFNIISYDLGYRSQFSFIFSSRRRVALINISFYVNIHNESATNVIMCLESWM